MTSITKVLFTCTINMIHMYTKASLCGYAAYGILQSVPKKERGFENDLIL